MTYLKLKIEKEIADIVLGAIEKRRNGIKFPIPERLQKEMTDEQVKELDKIYIRLYRLINGPSLWEEFVGDVHEWFEYRYWDVQELLNRLLTLLFRKAPKRKLCCETNPAFKCKCGFRWCEECCNTEIIPTWLQKFQFMYNETCANCPNCGRFVCVN